MICFAARRPTAVQRRQNNLADAFEDVGNVDGQIVEQQKPRKAKSRLQDGRGRGYQYRFQQDFVVKYGFKFGQFSYFRIQAAQAHFMPCRTQNLAEGVNVLQVKRIARVVFGNNQYGFRRFTGALHRILRGNRRQRDKVGIQIIEAAGEQIHIDRRNFVAGIAYIDRTVKRRAVYAPLRAEPRLDFGVIGQDFCLKRLKLRRMFGRHHRNFIFRLPLCVFDKMQMIMPLKE